MSPELTLLYDLAGQVVLWSSTAALLVNRYGSRASTTLTVLQRLLNALALNSKGGVK